MTKACGIFLLTDVRFWVTAAASIVFPGKVAARRLIWLLVREAAVGPVDQQGRRWEQAHGSCNFDDKVAIAAWMRDRLVIFSADPLELDDIVPRAVQAPGRHRTFS